MTKRNKIIIVIVVLALVGGGVFSYFWLNRNQYDAKTTSQSPTAQSDYTDGNVRDPNNGGSSSQGGAIDTGGKDVPNDGTGAASESGLISVLTPTANATVKNGTILSGTVKDDVTKVQYRLIDNETGVLAQGDLSVVDKAFSGMLQFSSRSSSGRLDVYSYDASGSEINTVELPVAFEK